MSEKNKFSLFGFRIGKKDETKEETQASFVPPTTDDGAITVSSSAAFLGTSIDQDGTAKNEVELISKYREMSVQPEIESAIEDIVNEAIVQDDDGDHVKLVLDDLKQPEKIKKAIFEEFNNIQKLLNFNNMASDIFRRYYIDGRLFYHVIIDVNNPQKGILELRYIDPRKIKKIKEVKKRKDELTGVEVVVSTEEYYLYNDRISSVGENSRSLTGIKISADSIINVNSGLMDTRRAMVLSYLHKAIKPLNQLRMIEDASIIYKISRAPQRRIFYVDVGNLPKMKAEQYLKDIMAKYKNKLVYDANTGEVRDDRRHLSMLEDFWMPRRADGKSTEIKTLESSDSFSDMSMVEYFEKKLYKSLNVPVTRLDPQQAFSIGRTAEITRDELKFSKFIDKLRNKFSELFDHALRIQLVLKGICTEDEWNEFKEYMFFDFIKDNNFTELKEAELMQERLGLLSIIDPYAGKYYSKNWIRRNVLRLDDEEIEEMDKEIEEENAQDMELQQQMMAAQQPQGEEIPGQEQEEETPEETQSQQKPQQSRANNSINPLNPYNK